MEYPCYYGSIDQIYIYSQSIIGYLQNIIKNSAIDTLKRHVLTVLDFNELLLIEMY